MRTIVQSLIIFWLITSSATAEDTYVVNFEDGAQGWVGPSGSGGATTIEPQGGNPGANMHTVFNNFFITFATTTNPAFVQDLSQFEDLTLAIDLKVDDISFFGSPVERPWLVEIRDYDDPPGGYPWVSVWYLFQWVGEGEWTTFSVSIEDPSMSELPEGWGGYGDEDPVTYEPRLPKDRTFTDVLAGADAVVFTTALPGYAFGFTDFDVRIDNITITTQELQQCPADLNNDGEVSAGDLGILLALWGHAKTAADLNHDGIVNAPDLGLLLVAWGDCS